MGELNDKLNQIKNIKQDIKQSLVNKRTGIS